MNVDKIKNIFQSKSADMEPTMESTQRTGIMEFFNSKKLVVTISLIVTVVIGFAVIWIIYNLVKIKSIDRKMYTVPETENPVLGNVVTVGNGNGIPEASNGKRFSLSFWMYLHNLDKNSGIIKHVLHRGSESSDLASAGSPMVQMDPNLNKLYIYFGKTTEDEPISTRTQFTDPPLGFSNETSNITKIEYYTAKRGITIDYVPLQRWVHIGAVVNESINSGSITSYIDGELVKTSTPNKEIKVTGTNTYTVKPSLTNMDLDRKGNIYIGGSDNNTIGLGFNGIISKVQFFNYDLNSQDMYNIYTQGPIHLSTAGKLANSIGLGGITNQYGVRNPLYKKPQLLV